MESNVNEKLTVTSFFAGVGGIDLGFDRAPKSKALSPYGR